MSFDYKIGENCALYFVNLFALLSDCTGCAFKDDRLNFGSILFPAEWWSYASHDKKRFQSSNSSVAKEFLAFSRRNESISDKVAAKVNWEITSLDHAAEPLSAWH